MERLIVDSRRVFAKAKEEETNHPRAKPDDQPVVGLPKYYAKYKDEYKARQVSRYIGVPAWIMAHPRMAIVVDVVPRSQRSRLVQRSILERSRYRQSAHRKHETRQGGCSA